MAELIDFAIWVVDWWAEEAQVQSYLLGGASNLANTIEPTVCSGDAVLCQITLTTCYHYYYYHCLPLDTNGTITHAALAGIS